MMDKTLGSNITHQVGESDAERLAAMAKRVREAEEHLATIQVAARRAMNFVAWEMNEEAETPKLFCRGCGQYRDEPHLDGCPVAAVRAALPAELLAQREREQAIIRAATEYRDADRQWRARFFEGDAEHKGRADAVTRAQVALYAAVDGLGAGEGDKECQ